MSLFSKLTRSQTPPPREPPTRQPDHARSSSRPSKPPVAGRSRPTIAHDTNNAPSLSKGFDVRKYTRMSSKSPAKPLIPRNAPISAPQAHTATRASHSSRPPFPHEPSPAQPAAPSLTVTFGRSDKSNAAADSETRETVSHAHNGLFSLFSRSSNNTSSGNLAPPHASRSHGGPDATASGSRVAHETGRKMKSGPIVEPSSSRFSPMHGSGDRKQQSIKIPHSTIPVTVSGDESQASRSGWQSFMMPSYSSHPSSQKASRKEHKVSSRPAAPSPQVPPRQPSPGRVVELNISAPPDHSNFVLQSYSNHGGAPTVLSIPTATLVAAMSPPSRPTLHSNDDTKRSATLLEDSITSPKLRHVAHAINPVQVSHPSKSMTIPFEPPRRRDEYISPLHESIIHEGSPGDDLLLTPSSLATSLPQPSDPATAVRPSMPHAYDSKPLPPIIKSPESLAHDLPVAPSVAQDVNPGEQSLALINLRSQPSARVTSPAPTSSSSSSGSVKRSSKYSVFSSARSQQPEVQSTQIQRMDSGAHPPLITYEPSQKTSRSSSKHTPSRHSSNSSIPTSFTGGPLPPTVTPVTIPVSPRDSFPGETHAQSPEQSGAATPVGGLDLVLASRVTPRVKPNVSAPQVISRDPAIGAPNSSLPRVVEVPASSISPASIPKTRAVAVRSNSTSQIVSASQLQLPDVRKRPDLAAIRSSSDLLPQTTSRSIAARPPEAFTSERPKPNPASARPQPASRHLVIEQAPAAPVATTETSDRRLVVAHGRPVPVPSAPQPQTGMQTTTETPRFAENVERGVAAVPARKQSRNSLPRAQEVTMTQSDVMPSTPAAAGRVAAILNTNRWSDPSSAPSAFPTPRSSASFSALSIDQPPVPAPTPVSLASPIIGPTRARVLTSAALRASVPKRSQDKVSGVGHQSSPAANVRKPPERPIPRATDTGTLPNSQLAVPETASRALRVGTSSSAQAREQAARAPAHNTEPSAARASASRALEASPSLDLVLASKSAASAPVASDPNKPLAPRALIGAPIASPISTAPPAFQTTTVSIVKRKPSRDISSPVPHAVPPALPAPRASKQETSAHVASPPRNLVVAPSNYTNVLTPPTRPLPRPTEPATSQAFTSRDVTPGSTGPSKTHPVSSSKISVPTTSEVVDKESTPKQAANVQTSGPDLDQSSERISGKHSVRPPTPARMQSAPSVKGSAASTSSLLPSASAPSEQGPKRSSTMPVSTSTPKKESAGPNLRFWRSSRSHSPGHLNAVISTNSISAPLATKFTNGSGLFSSRSSRARESLSRASSRTSLPSGASSFVNGKKSRVPSSNASIHSKHSNDGAPPVAHHLHPHFVPSTIPPSKRFSPLAFLSRGRRDRTLSSASMEAHGSQAVGSVVDGLSRSGLSEFSPPPSPEPVERLVQDWSEGLDTMPRAIKVRKPGVTWDVDRGESPVASVPVLMARDEWQAT